MLPLVAHTQVEFHARSRIRERAALATLVLLSENVVCELGEQLPISILVDKVGTNVANQLVAVGQTHHL